MSLACGWGLISIRSGHKFDDQFGGTKSERRVRLEQSVEYEYKDLLETNCKYERVRAFPQDIPI
jgi:hypothetical protein